MHNIDRMGLETSWETGEYEGEYSDEYGFSAYEGEYEGEYGYEMEFGGELESPFDEAEEMQLAAELLEITNDEELEQFLGKLISSVGRKLGTVVKSPIGRMLGGALKGVAKKFLPVAGAAVGNMLVPGLGGVVGGNLAGMAGKAFGLELEGMSPEDQEFEVARRFVRLAGDASAKAAAAPSNVAPAVAVKDALQKAAQTHAPGLAAGAATPVRHAGRRGSWIRRGRTIVLFGV
jgi:hypothetical protein